VATRPKFFRPVHSLKLKPSMAEAERLKFYSSTRWKRFREMVLNRHPVCQKCGREESRVVHHLVERLDDPELSLEETNVVAWCKSCHSRHHKSGH
jgi:5-methylcytosine-specific restriction enzyme A